MVAMTIPLDVARISVGNNSPHSNWRTGRIPMDCMLKTLINQRHIKKVVGLEHKVHVVKEIFLQLLICLGNRRLGVFFVSLI